jgi:hypothetical protein
MSAAVYAFARSTPLLDDERRVLRCYAQALGGWPQGMSDECFIACRSELFRRGFIAHHQGRSRTPRITLEGRLELLSLGREVAQ